MKQLYPREVFITQFGVIIELSTRQACELYDTMHSVNAASRLPHTVNQQAIDRQYLVANTSNIYKKKKSKDLASEPRIDPYFCIATEKRSYPSKKSAKKHLRKIQTSIGSNHYRIPIAYYQCEFCNKWHLTSKERKKLAA